MTVIDPAKVGELDRRVGVLESLLEAERDAKRLLAEELSREHAALVSWQRLAQRYGREASRLRQVERRDGRLEMALAIRKRLQRDGVVEWVTKTIDDLIASERQVQAHGERV